MNPDMPGLLDSADSLCKLIGTKLLERFLQKELLAAHPCIERKAGFPVQSFRHLGGGTRPRRALTLDKLTQFPVIGAPDMAHEA